MGAISSSSGGSAYIMFDNGSDLRIANVQGDFNINDTITGGDSGATANLDYFETSKSSILIGNNTSTAGYHNSIAIGNGATNTENNQMIIESTKGLERFKLKLDHTQQSAVTFTGSGLDTLFISGTFSRTYPTTYTVTIDGNNQDFIAVDTSSITGGTFAISDVITNGTGGTATILSVNAVTLQSSATLLRVNVSAGTFNPGDTIDNGSGVTATTLSPVIVKDTYTWTDGTTTENNVYLVNSNGLILSLDSGTGYTIGESWTWTYSNVQNDILDFSNGTYKFGTDFGTDYFGYQITDNLFGFGIKGSVNTYTNVAGDQMLTGYADPTGLGFIGFASINTYSSGEIASIFVNKNGVGYSIQDSYGENVIQSVSGVTTIGSLSGGNNTKITIDDVNEHITISNLPAYDDDTAAGVGGLTAGMVYMTTGSGSAPLNAAGILMIKQ